MDEYTAEDLSQRIMQLNLLDARQLQAAWSQFSTRDVSPDEFLNRLVRRGLMTNYQVERLKRGEKTGFFYGDYKVLYLVGTGTFARVYRAVHNETEQIVAVKVLRKRFSDEPKEKDQFLHEGKVGTTLRHPNIVPIFEVHTFGRSHFLVMEFVEGQNLREFMKIRRKLSPLEATRIIADVSAGLAYAFQQGITHRDLKLSNVLLSSTGRAQLVDFGLAAIDDNLSDDAVAEHPNPRTIDYAALERSTGVRKGDPRSDVYFCGCMYYHLLTGEAALLETTDRIQRLNKSRFENARPVNDLEPDLPVYLTMVVNKAMEFRPERRYQTPAEMHSELKATIQRLNAAKTVEKTGAETPEGITPGDMMEGISRSVMIVESNASLQDRFREGLKKLGYRVLVIRDPSRALERLNSSPCPVDCVVFSTRELGRASLDAYNQLLQLEHTRNLPAVLLLDQAQATWEKHAELTSHRVSLVMPIKFKQFRRALKDLIERHRTLADA